MDDRPILDKTIIAWIAKNVSRAFNILQGGLKNGTLTAAELNAIDSLPSGIQHKRSPVDGSLIERVEMTGRKRLTGFPKMCCADVTATLGIIYTMAGVKPEDIIEVKAMPRKTNPAFNFHMWLSVQGLRIDLTLGQFHPLNETIGNAIAFTQHPFEADNAYTITESQFIPPTETVKFAEFVGFNCVFKNE